MTANNNKLVGANTDYLYYWDNKYGWVHYMDGEKITEAYIRFLEEMKS